MIIAPALALGRQKPLWIVEISYRGYALLMLPLILISLVGLLSVKFLLFSFRNFYSIYSEISPKRSRYFFSNASACCFARRS